MSSLQIDNITVDAVHLPSFNEKSIAIDVLRLDKIHPVISGNKWFKLRFYIADALTQQKTTIVTWGGAWSNHIVAAAAACQENNLQSIGIIRGEQPAALSQTLKDAQEYGMQLHFVGREQYRLKILPVEINAQNENLYFIDEGGYGIMGANGAATMADFLTDQNYTDICCATGTGTMTAGLIKILSSGQKIIGISTLKNNHSIINSIENLVSTEEKQKNYTINHDYHFGGYAKQTSSLIDFMNWFYQQTAIPSDFVYTGKLFFAIHDLINKNYFPPGSRILMIHSGGLQGNASLKPGTLMF